MAALVEVKQRKCAGYAQTTLINEQLLGPPMKNIQKETEPLQPASAFNEILMSLNASNK